VRNGRTGSHPETADDQDYPSPTTCSSSAGPSSRARLPTSRPATRTCPSEDPRRAPAASAAGAFPRGPNGFRSWLLQMPLLIQAIGSIAGNIERRGTLGRSPATGEWLSPAVAFIKPLRVDLPRVALMRVAPRQCGASRPVPPCTPPDIGPGAASLLLDWLHRGVGGSAIICIFHCLRGRGQMGCSCR
jgi:hypothetical protein